ncbi:transposase [Acinetobacter sp. ANC 4779]|nr:transposase [Acinetobacter sp. ANC 4779]
MSGQQYTPEFKDEADKLRLNLNILSLRLQNV